MFYKKRCGVVTAIINCILSYFLVEMFIKVSTSQKICLAFSTQ